MDVTDLKNNVYKDGCVVHFSEPHAFNDDVLATDNYILLDYDGINVHALPVYPMGMHCSGSNKPVVMYNESDGKSIEKDFVPLLNIDKTAFVRSCQIDFHMYCYANLDKSNQIPMDYILDDDFVSTGFICEQTIDDIT